jgi:hypothetical protein
MLKLTPAQRIARLEEFERFREDLASAMDRAR